MARASNGEPSIAQATDWRAIHNLNDGLASQAKQFSEGCTPKPCESESEARGEGVRFKIFQTKKIIGPAPTPNQLIL